MKKFIRFVIFVTVTLLVVYLFSFINECNQLKSTFGTFLLFNDSGSVKSCVLGNESLKSDYGKINLFDSPLPIWSRIDEVYVYSAFWDHSKHSSVGLGVGPSIRDISLYSCHVWFDLRNIIHSASGTLNILSSPSSRNPDIYIFNFFCHVNEEDVSGKPYLLILIHNSNKKAKKHMVPIFNQETDSSVNKTAICVLPDRAGVGKASVVEFVSFHQLIGLSDLLVYGGETNFGLINQLKQLIGFKGFLRSVAILPWNFPYDDISLEIQVIEIDCSLRTRGLTQAFALLEWDQYIVTKTGIPILSLLPLPSPSSNLKYQFKSEVCCLEQKNDKKSELSWPIVLQKMQCMDYPFYGIFKSIGLQGHGNPEVIHNFANLVSIKTYRSCISLNNVETQYDHSPMKFLSGLLQSRLLILWNSGQLL